MPADNLTRRIRVFAGLVTALAVAGVALGWAAYGVGRWQVLVVLAVAAWIAEGRAMPVSATRKLELSVTFIPIVLAAVLFGPAAGGLVGLAGMLADRRGPIERFAIYAASRTLGGVMAGTVAMWVGDAVGGPRCWTHSQPRSRPASPSCRSTCCRPRSSPACAA